MTSANSAAARDHCLCARSVARPMVHRGNGEGPSERAAAFTFGRERPTTQAPKTLVPRRLGA